MQSEIQLVFLVIFGCLIMFCLALSIVLFTVIHQRRMLEKEKKIKEMEYEKQIGMFKAVSEAEDREKERISRNLHDEINPMLVMLKHSLQKHKFDLLKNKFDIQTFDNDFELIDKMADGIRTSCYDLVPSFMLDYGLLKSLEDFARGLNSTGNVSAHFTADFPEDAALAYSKHDQLNIYRMSLELTNNILKHSSCTELTLSMSMATGKLVISISHNGRGVSNTDIAELTEHSTGLGLKSLQARALILHATINYTKGSDLSSVSLTLPFEHEKEN